MPPAEDLVPAKEGVISSQGLELGEELLVQRLYNQQSEPARAYDDPLCLQPEWMPNNTINAGGHFYTAPGVYICRAKSGLTSVLAASGKWYRVAMSSKEDGSLIEYLGLSPPKKPEIKLNKTEERDILKAFDWQAVYTHEDGILTDPEEVLRRVTANKATLRAVAQAMKKGDPDEIPTLLRSAFVNFTKHGDTEALSVRISAIRTFEEAHAFLGRAIARRPPAYPAAGPNGALQAAAAGEMRRV